MIAQERKHLYFTLIDEDLMLGEKIVTKQASKIKDETWICFSSSLVIFCHFSDTEN